ncbi:RHS repeat-associated core domain-containing protein [Pseudomonas sp. NyZ480]|uniref:RHS repeat-associated core domain-containing protein n=1 Tax=Pseudomonas sp. NyZ480 TaxID=3035289 RepID=UPI0024097919|nr:RHS repeat-associated core domain-containing protein [Pseudomonas sp. NyZ480]WEZ88368.1 RHS repeat-associated core domain-containing protein [Pseudomonas sp. NyZ480]
MTDKLPAITYTVYGYQHNDYLNKAFSGFNGGIWHSELDGYFMGNGHRTFSTVRMRFNSPDSLSPFDEGGINSYVYCGDDPVNFTDPTGMSRVYFLHRFMPKQQKVSPSQHFQSAMADDLLFQPGKAKKPRKHLRLEDLSAQTDYNHYNDYSDQQLKQKARRFNELLSKEDARPKRTSHETSKYFQASTRYRSNLNAIVEQYSMRYPDHALSLSDQGRNFWESSDSGMSIYSTASTSSPTASTGVLSHNNKTVRSG